MSIHKDKGLKRIMRESWEKLLDIIYPHDVRCNGCGKEIMPGSPHGLCDFCLMTMPYVKGHQCRICGTTDLAEHMDHCFGCQHYIGLIDGGIAAFEYSGLGRRIIKKFKFNDARYLARPIGGMLSDLLAATYGGEIDALVYVPCHKKREQLRGFNQAELIAEEVSKRTGIPVLKAAIRRNRDTSRLSKLSRSERMVELENAFDVPEIWQHVIAGKRIGIVDDIFTTGTTMGLCAMSLKASGAKAVYAITASVRKK